MHQRRKGTPKRARPAVLLLDPRPLHAEPAPTLDLLYLYHVFFEGRRDFVGLVFSDRQVSTGACGVCACKRNRAMQLPTSVDCCAPHGTPPAS
jgi:hypothetical protein